MRFNSLVKLKYNNNYIIVLILLAVFMSLFLFTSPASAKISKCGPGNCRNICLEYETETIKVGGNQGYYISGGQGPFKISFVQNMGNVKVDWISPRSFRLTGTITTERFGVGPVQFYIWEDSGYKCATGNGLLYISEPRVVQPPSDKHYPPKSDLQTTCDISGTWQHGTTETWTFTPLGNNRYSAQEKGFGNASGIATIAGNRVRIDYTTKDGRIKGYYEVALNAGCNLAEGRWADSQPAGGQSRMVRVTERPPFFDGNLGRDVVLADEFAGNILDTSKWETRVANGKGSGFGYGQGQHISVSGNTLTLRQNATDNGGAVVTKPIFPVRGKILKITKQTFLHYANNNYAGTTAILGEDTTKDIFAQVGYYHYGDVNSFNAGHMRSPAIQGPVWDKWFNEVITYDPATGQITYSINGGMPVSFAGRPSSASLRVGLHSYGWFTGHYQTINNIRIEWIDSRSIIDPPPITDFKPKTDLNGLWQCLPETMQNCYAIFYHEGAEVKVLGTYSYEGRKIVWFGNGTMQGNKLNFNFHHTSNTAPVNWQDSVMDLNLSQDGNSFSGTYTRTIKDFNFSSGGPSFPIQFRRVR